MKQSDDRCTLSCICTVCPLCLDTPVQASVQLNCKHKNNLSNIFAGKLYIFCCNEDMLTINVNIINIIKKNVNTMCFSTATLSNYVVQHQVCVSKAFLGIVVCQMCSIGI